MRSLRIARAYLRMSVQTMLAYRANAIMDLVVSVMWLGWELTAINVIYANTDAIGGWVVGDLIALLGVWKLLMGFSFTVMSPNTEQFNKAVRDGTLDYVFLLPADSQFLVSVQRVSILQLHNVAQAAFLIPLGMSMTGRVGTLPELLAFLLLALNGMVLIYALWIVLLAAVFWFTKFDNNVTIIQALTDAGRYPSTVYPAWLRLLVTFVVPIAVATTVPLQALRGDLSALQVAGFMALGAAAFGLARLVWRAGVRRYSGASA